MKTAVFFLTFFIFEQAYAYVNFIGHGYTSCLNCHFNPFGGGPLNDYGRAVSATAISSRLFYPKTISEEKLAYMSGFLFRKPKQEFIRTQLNYRGFQYVSNPGSSRIETKEWIDMQLDGRLILKFGESDKFIAVANYGFAPRPRGRENGKRQDEWRSREHYVGYRLSQRIGLYAGLMDKVFGLRVLEHIAFSRSTPQVTQNDQVHGLTGHFLLNEWEGGAQAFVGNLHQEQQLRMKGASFMVERTVLGSHRLGASVMKSENNFLQLTSYSAHARMNLKEGAAILAELGQTHRKTENGSDDRTARYGLLQTYLRPMRGLYAFNNIEFLKRDIVEDGYTVKWGPGVQFFPFQRVELRFDLSNTRNFSAVNSTKDTWMYLFQTHIWL